MQEVQLDKKIQLLDSPGIVMATGGSDSHTILKNCVKVETIDDPLPAVNAILKRCNKHQVMSPELNVYSIVYSEVVQQTSNV